MSKKINLATSLKYRDSNMFTDEGELNAASTQDALKMLAKLSKYNLIDMHTTEEATAKEARNTVAEETKLRREAITAAMEDTTGETHRELGQEMAGVINETLTRNSLIRQIAQYQPLNQGERPETYVQEKNIECVVTSGGTEVTTQLVRDNLVMQPEVDIQARVFVEKRKIDSTREDVLQRKLNEAEEQVLVSEDRIFKNAVDVMAARYNREAISVSAEISPTVLGTGMDLISGFNVPLAKILFSSYLWTKLATNKDFENLIDPVTRLEIIRTGRVGTLYGAELLTDAYREPTQKVLSSNETYYFSDPQFIGEYTDRGGVESIPIGAGDTGIAGLGWHLVESFSFALTNYRGVAKTTLA